MKYIVIAGIVLIAGFLVALSFIPIGIEPLTEVYFENHTTLPINIFLNSTYNFTFSVHNLEYRSMNYTYNITAETANKTGFLASEAFSLGDNETATFRRNFAFSESFDRAKIQVLVAKDNNETIDIHFWVDEYVPVRITIIKDNETLVNRG